MSEIVSKLEQFQSSTPSHWRKKALIRQQNNTWIRYSQNIALKMLDKMEELHLTQKQLAERMGCSQQYISKVLRGQENLSIETMAKIDNYSTPN